MINKQETSAISKELGQESLLTTRNLSKMAMIIALYVVLTLLISPLSYGMIQIRLAEMFNFLAIYHRRYIGAVTLGVALANLSSPLGMVDVIVGSVSTFIVLTIIYFVSQKLTTDRQKLLCVLIICSLSMFTVAGELHLLLAAPFWLSWVTIGVGEFISLTIGLVIIWLMSRMTDMTRIKKMLQ